MQHNEREALLEIYRDITHNIDEFLYSINRENEKEDVFFTDGIKIITGYTSEEIISLPGRIFSLIHAEDAFAVRKQYSDFENDPQRSSLTLIYRIIHKSGKTLWLRDTRKAERCHNGNILRIYGIASDVTDLKETELELKKSSDHLKQLNAAKDRFISIVSHDLRAPFTSILGFAEILLNEPMLPEEEKKEYLNYIYESSNTQLQLVKYLLDWSRLQLGKIRIEPQRIKAASIIENCIAALSGNARKKGITVSCSIKDDIYLNADEKLLNQVISNLLNNAIKFTQENKSVDISVNHFKEGFVEVVVRDEGIGIPEANQAKIFRFDEKFSTDGTNGEKGSGLGLTLVKEIVEKHGGDIWFYSEEFKGSEFHFTVPEASRLVIIVEDDSSTLSLLSRLVRKAMPGFNIVEAQNGYEAINLIMREMPSLIITDHYMPLMNGTQLIESVRKLDSGANVPVIVVAGILSDDIKSRYIDMCVSIFLNKPIEVGTFSQAIEEAISL
ncbi:MAG: ATP-binding protein [Bacteroidota bacterium]